MFTFRTSITFAVMAFIVALAALLIAIQVLALRWATREAASAYMDATSTKAFGRLQTEITAIASLVNVLATSSGPVAELVGIEGGVVSGVINLESSGVEASD